MIIFLELSVFLNLYFLIFFVATIFKDFTCEIFSLDISLKI